VETCKTGQERDLPFPSGSGAKGKRPSLYKVGGKWNPLSMKRKGRAEYANTVPVLSRETILLKLRQKAFSAVLGARITLK
jgi:hypothetical protein